VSYRRAMDVSASEPYFYALDGQELAGRAQAVELPPDDPRHGPVLQLQLKRRPGDAEELGRRAQDGDQRAQVLLRMLRLGHPLAWWMASHPDLVVSFALPGIPPSSVSLEPWQASDPQTTLLRVGTVAIPRAEHDARLAAGEDPFAGTLDPGRPAGA
jgi:hypothetical protein